MNALPTLNEPAPSGTAESALSVYFDGACPICKREIAFYRRRRGADAIEWVDLRKSATEDVAPGLSCSVALARFHIRTPDGSLKSGAAAFAELWQALPAFRIAGKIAAWPPVAYLLEWGYRGLLKVRPTVGRWLSRR